MLKLRAQRRFDLAKGAKYFLIINTKNDDLVMYF